METEKFTGVVVWFNDKLGYGFCKRNDDGQEFFTHFSNIVGVPGVHKTLVAGQSVRFGIGANQRGPQAIEVEVIGEPEYQN